MAMQYRRDIDGLRAIAVLSVVLYHAFGAPLTGGFVGVDIFFVISGFIITTIITDQFQNARFSFLDFLERRVRRILPPLFVVIAVSMALGTWLYLPEDLTNLGASAVWSLLFTANFFFLIEIDYFAASPDSYPLLHLWSLAVEEQFYVVLPLVFLLFWRSGAGWVFGAVAILSLLSLICAVAIYEIYPKGAFYMLPARFWELGVGVLLALSKLSRPSGIWAHGMSFAGIGLILFAVVFYTEQTPFPGLAALPPVIGTALIIWAGPQSIVGRILGVRPLVAIGLVSYGFYLWHWPLLAFYRYGMMGEVTVVGLALVVLLALALSALSYRVIEQPIRRRQMMFRGRGRIFVMAALCAMTLGGAGGVLRASDGLPERWSEQALTQLNANNQSQFGASAGCSPVGELQAQFLCGVGPQDGAIDFIVWGDSHTISMQAGFQRFAEETGRRGVLIGRSACIGLQGARNTRMPLWHDCDGHNDRMLAYIAEVQPQTVFLVSRWLNATHFEFPATEHARSWLANSLPILRRGTLESALDETLRILRDAEIERIVWMRTVPEQQYDIPRLMARSQEWERPLPEAPLVEDWADRHRAIDRIFAQHTDLVVMAPEQYLCLHGQCDFQMDNAPLYDDTHHISRVGSERLWPLIADAMAPSLPQ